MWANGTHRFLALSTSCASCHTRIYHEMFALFDTLGERRSHVVFLWNERS